VEKAPVLWKKFSDMEVLTRKKCFGDIKSLLDRTLSERLVFARGLARSI
jgi:hypothetical protein